MTHRPIIPPEALTQHIAIVGKTGAGKTVTAKGIVEQLLAERRRVCIIDPTGAWWGLRSSADGKKAGFPIVVFGGEHADIPIGEHAGAAVAELLGDANIPAVIDLSEFLIGARHRFMEAFAAALHKVNREPLHLIIDEADEVAPQNPLPETKRMLHQIDRLVRRGRIRGFRVMLITQRPAVLHKNILTQANTLIAMRLTGPQDRAALNEWIKGQGDLEKGKEVIASLARLRRGEGWVWAPEQDVLRRVTFPMIKTFDSSSAPEDRGTLEPARLASVDLTSIRERFAAAEEEAKANDPKLLRQRIAELERELRKAPMKATSDELKEAWADGSQAGAGDAWKKAQEGILPNIKIAGADLESARVALSDIEASLRAMHTAMEANGLTGAAPRVNFLPPPSGERKLTSAPKPKKPAAVNSDLTGPQRQFLRALAWWWAMGHSSVTRPQLAAIAGWRVTSGHLKNVAGSLRTLGLIDYPTAGTIALTDDGAASAPEPDLNEHLRDSIRAVVTGPQRQVFDVLVANRSSLTRDQVARACGWEPTSGHVKNVLGSMRSLELITYPAPGSVELADWVRL
jgi:hypothetical protein